VVADEVRTLAKKSMELANKNTSDSEDLYNVLGRLMEITKTLSEQIGSIKTSTGYIVDSVLGIANKSVETMSMLDSLKSSESKK